MSVQAHAVRIGRVAPVPAVRVRIARATAHVANPPTPSPKLAGRPGAHRGSRAVRTVRARRWRNRSRRAQVSAIATILGLLLVVSFIANYLATTLPSQMKVNESNHGLQVENQVGHMLSLMMGLTSTGSAGAPVTQPITLGTAGIPPFGTASGGQIAPVTGQANSSVKLGLYSVSYGPPNGRGPNNGSLPAGCTNGSTPLFILWACNQGGVVVAWNFNDTICKTMVGPCVIYVTTNGGSTLRLNYALNNTNFTVNTTGQGKGNQTIGLFGSYDTAVFQTAGGLLQTFTIVGNHDQVTINPTSGANVSVLVVGAYDNITFVSSGGSSNIIRVAGWGTYLNVAPGNGGTYYVNYTGFNPNNSTGLCPQGTLSGTDSVGAFPKNSPNGTVTWLNNSPIPPGQNLTTPPANPTPPKQGWWYIGRIPLVQYPCKWFTTFVVGAVAGIVPASLAVRLLNDYSAYAEVAMDQGAVIYAQRGGIPVMIDPPPFTFSNGRATIWVPEFINGVRSQAGTGTANILLRPIANQLYAFPGTGWSINPSKALVMNFSTPYYVAWMNYLCGKGQFSSSTTLTLPAGSLPAGYTNPLTCGQFNNTAVRKTYNPGGPVGMVSVSIVPNAVVLRVSLFAITTSE